jgi:hypothetical protein
MDESQASKYAEIRAEVERRRLELIETQLEVGLAFARIARNEYSVEEFARAEQAISSARRAYRVIVKSLTKAQPSEKERQRVESKLKELEQALEQLPKLRKVRGVVMRSGSPEPQSD